MKHQITVLPKNKIIYADEGALLLDVLRQNGFYLPAACGGKGTCGKCKVHLIAGAVEGTKPDADGMILSCHARVCSPLTVALKEAAGDGLALFSAVSVGGERHGLGAILDIGTTTLAACLIDLQSGEILAKTSALNPQGVYGADVLSRINAYADGNGAHLQSLILDRTREMLTELCQNYSNAVEELVVAANTTMLHLFLGTDPSTIGVYPFTPVFTAEQVVDGESLGLPVKTVRLLPSVSAYVGSDITAGALACNMYDTQKSLLFVDVGTNGEIVLSHKDKRYGASTAAGPALEGACMECGMGGVSGAIDRVFEKDGTLQFTTIDKMEAHGICGSGYIDLFALLLHHGLIDEMGAWNPDCASPLLRYFKDDRFYLTEEIYLSQQDIRQFQLAKSAIAAGIVTLLSHCEVTPDELDALYLAGGLGYYMNIENAARTGLLPRALVKKTQPVGNTALAGARLALLSKQAHTRLQKIAEETEIVELSFSATFQDAYVENMMFLENEV